MWSLLNSRRTGSKNLNKFYKTGVADYNSLSSNLDDEINQLKYQSRELLFRISEGTGFRELDLHQLTLDEALNVVDKVLNHLEDQMDKRNCKR